MRQWTVRIVVAGMAMVECDEEQVVGGGLFFREAKSIQVASVSLVFVCMCACVSCQPLKNCPGSISGIGVRTSQ